VTSPLRRNRSLQALAITASALPLAGLIVAALSDGLGANPIETVTHVTGDWTLRFLLLSLCVTPVRRLLGWSWIAPLRRTLGLIAFGYACCHFLTFVGLDHFFDWQAIVEDVVKRRYVTAGFAAFLCLVPVAATSTRGMVRRLGRRWASLHRLVYLAAALGVVHYVWLVKSDLRAPLAYAAALACLLGVRLWFWRRGSRVRSRIPNAAESRASRL